MKRMNPTGRLAALLFAAGTLCGVSCAKETVRDGGDLRNAAFEVTVASSPAGSNKIADPPQAAGRCTADRVRILVFKNASGSESTSGEALKTFLFDQRIDADAFEEAGTGNWIARGSFAVVSSATYRVMGVAYNSADEALLGDGYAGTSYYDAPVEIRPLLAGGEPSYRCPEFFKGSLSAAGSTSGLIRGWEQTGSAALHGDLYRVSGRAEIEINNIPDDIAALTLVVEKFTTALPLYDQTNGIENILGQPSEVAVGAFKIGSTRQFTVYDDGRGRTAVLTADLFKAAYEEVPRPSGSAYFIDATDNDGSTVRYMVRAKDKWINTPYIMIVELIVESSMFRVPENYRLYIHGDFEKLKTGNVLIDASPITDEYFGGTLDPAD